MAAKLKPYPEYKDSSLQWLGMIPTNWKLLRSKYIFREVDVRSKTGGETHLSMSQKHGLVESSKVDDLPLQSESYLGGKLCKKNDLVLNRLKAHLGVFACASQDGVVSPDYSVFRIFSDDEVRFFELVFKTPTYIAELRKSTKGIVEGFWRLYTDDFYNIRVPVPPIDEQQVILHWINDFDGKVRRFILAKHRLIELLGEQKQAIIHRAVTRGLDPNVRLKPSGIEWLGDVPEHWEMKRCHYLFREVDSRSVDGSEEHLSMSQRLGLVPSHLVENSTLISESYAGGKLCEVGDLVLNRLKAHLGVFSLARYAGVISPDYTVLRPIDPESVAYFEMVLRSPACRRELHIRAKGIVEGFWRLYTDDFYDIRLPVPPLLERHAIIAFIRSATFEIDHVAQVTERQIILLREYRTCLIADVVTGKLDVRGVTLPAVEEAGATEEWNGTLDAEMAAMEDQELPEVVEAGE